MKTLCNCNFCHKDVYLNTQAQTRQQLSNTWGRFFYVNCPLCKNQNYIDVNFVRAESAYKNAPIPGILAGAGVGAWFGPIGLVGGLIVGGLAGRSIRSSDKPQVDRFNHYYVY